MSEVGTSATAELRVAEAAERLRTTFGWIDVGSWDAADLRVLAAVALGVEPEQADVEKCMGLGWSE